MADFALGMGSNLGDRINNLVEGVRYLLSRSRMGMFRLSGVYETPAIEGVEGGNFLNCVLAGLFYGPVEELLSDCREAEVLLGSMVRKQNASRSLDIDLLFFGEMSRNDEELTLPHPGIGRRRFVLKPLSDVWESKIPVLKATPAELLNKCSDKSRILLIHDPPVRGCFWEVNS
jgi:2-amino-4-hydroxy-6-hydroxymethyldihydropteridine diphosphokinase